MKWIGRLVEYREEHESKELRLCRDKIKYLENDIGTRGK